MDKQTVKYGIECRWRMRQVKTHCCLLLSIPLFTLFAALFSTEGKSFDPSTTWEIIGATVGYMSIAYGIIFLPFVAYNLYRYLELVRNYEKYSVHSVVLSQPHTSMLYKNSVYFTVSIDSRAAADTSPLFSDSWLSVFTLNEYAGSTVRVLYDEEKGKVYLIDKV